MTLMRPPCSTTYRTFGIVGSCTISNGKWSPCVTSGTSCSCACDEVAAPQMTAVRTQILIERRIDDDPGMSNERSTILEKDDCLTGSARGWFAREVVKANVAPDKTSPRVA